MDSTVLFNVSYGLYVLTANDNGRDNGCIINTLLQVTSVAPFTCVITVNKANFTHDLIMDSAKFNISILSTAASFDVFKQFGFQSGKNVDKFGDTDHTPVARSANGLIYLPQGTNGYLSFHVNSATDFGSHTMFTATLTQAQRLSKEESLTYAYYQAHIKPKPTAAPDAQKPGHRCMICNFVYEGEDLPPDFICPICKHGVGDFEKITT